ncbi:MAG: CDP-alcohol phosphatidyltransferase family protein [Acidobacteria bacterium]|nr:CDP-alcohol phosphatidyltransferase family protein [Acidobacteriota bacterium]
MSHHQAQPCCVHTRENRGLLAVVERRALVWIAERLPPRINSDHLSGLGLVAMAAAGLSFAAFRFTPWAAAGVVAALAANWFGDSLDGTVARVRGQQRPRYGFYVDHLIDLAGTTLLLAGLACSTLMSPLACALLLAAYLLVSAEMYLATHAAGVFRMSFGGFGPTELRVLLAIGALQAAIDPWVSLHLLGPIRLFDLGALVASAGLAVVFVVSAVRNTRALSVADPRPTRITD